MKRILNYILFAMIGASCLIALTACGNPTPGINGGTSMPKDKDEQSLAEGMEFYNSGDYESAMECFESVPTYSRQYEESQSMLVKCELEYGRTVIENANKYAAKGEYEIAFNLLNNARQHLSDDTAISSAYDTIFSEYRGVVCANANLEAETFISEGDYPSAIKAIDNAIAIIGQDDELLAKRTAYVDKYVLQTVSAAEEQYIKYNYDSIMAAEEILETALVALPDNETLLAELAFYKEHEPIRLLDLSGSSGCNNTISTRSFEYAGNKTDVSGTVYNDAVAPTGWRESWVPENSSYAQYSWWLDYQYTKVTGTLFFSESYKNADIDIELTITPSSGTAQSFFISNTDKARHFDVDLTGSKDLKIGIRQSEIDGTYAYLANVYVWK